MRILVVSPYSPPADGIGEHTRHLVEQWAARGDVLVLAPGQERPLLDAAPSGPVSVLRALSWRRRRSLRTLVTTWRPDVVICQFAVSALTSGVFAAIDVCTTARSRGAKVTMAFHEPVREIPRLGPFGPILYRHAARAANVAVAYSSIGAQALERIGVDAVIVPHGTPSFGIETPSTTRHPLVLALGFIHPDKGTDTLLAAAEEIVSCGVDPRIVIAGEPRQRRGLFRWFGRADAAFAAQLHHQALSTPGVSLSGFIPDEDLPGLLASAAVVVLPYRNATQSGIASLVTAAHTPAVASDLPGLREQLATGALFVPPGDADALATAVVRILQDEELGTSLRQAAAARAVETSYAHVADAILEQAVGS